MARRYSRRISPMERLAFAVNEIYHYHVDGVMEGTGDVDPAALQAAVDRAAEANPAIRVRLKGRLGLARWVDSGIAPQVRVMPKANWDGNSEEGAPFLKEKLDGMRGGPIADILIVPCADGLTRIVFRTQHAAIDGRGFMHWCYEVFRAMRGEPLQGSTSTFTDLDVQAQYADKVPDEPPAEAVSTMSVVAAGPPDGAPLHYIWRRLVLNRNISQLLPKAAAFIAEYARRREPGEVAFMIPVDYRGLRTEELGLGNLTGYVRLTVPEGARARNLMVQIHKRIQAYADCRPVPGKNALLWLPVSLLSRRISTKIEGLLYHLNPVFGTGGLVSMGTVLPESFAFPGFVPKRLHGIPGAVGKLNIVFLNDNDTSTICFTAPARYNDQGQFDAFVEAFRAHFSESGQDG